MVLFYLFLFAAVIQVGYALLLFIRVFSLPAAATPVSVQERLPVSIIICAKNEAANLRKNLPLILAQRYSNDAGIPLYEVIVVNDASTDDTEEVLKELALKCRIAHNSRVKHVVSNVLFIYPT